MIRVEINVDHDHGSVEVIEVDPQALQTEKQVRVAVEIAAARAARRAICALTAKER